MVVEYIRYTIDAGRAAAFEQAYRDAAEALEASDHCERYEVSRCSENPTQYVVRIEWDSEDGHLSGFRESPEFASWSNRRLLSPMSDSSSPASRANPTRGKETKEWRLIRKRSPLTTTCESTSSTRRQRRF
jgi:heme-degrading monooxygenase HmoA